MARKKKNKKQQTFNVYPFLAEYGITNLPLSKAGALQISPCRSSADIRKVQKKKMIKVLLNCKMKC